MNMMGIESQKQSYIDYEKEILEKQNLALRMLPDDLKTHRLDEEEVTLTNVMQPCFMDKPSGLADRLESLGLNTYAQTIRGLLEERKALLDILAVDRTWELIVPLRNAHQMMRTRGL